MPPSKSPAAARPLRVCLDLNIWCGRFLSVKAGRKGSATQMLVNMVRRGRFEELPVQLIISWGMLNRLGTVLTREWQVPHDTAELLTGAIAQYASLGPSGLTPHLLLGGTGVAPLRDVEDAHVLDTAIAGRADYLVTHDLADFDHKDLKVIKPNEEYRCMRGGHELTIIHTYAMLPRLREMTVAGES